MGKCLHFQVQQKFNMVIKLLTFFHFSKSRPFCMHMDDILFKAPVEVGNLLYFNSQICYTQDNYVQTRVSAEVLNSIIIFCLTFFCKVLNPKTGELSVTNVFHYTFLIKGNKEPPTIIPKTYHEVTHEILESNLIHIILLCSPCST